MSSLNLSSSAPPEQGASSEVPRSGGAHWPAVLLSLVVSAVFIYLALHNADLGKSWRTLANLNWRLLLLPAFLFMIDMLLRGWRWHLLYEPEHRPRFVECFRILCIGTAANNLLPARAGDVARFMLIGRGEKSGGSSRALATMGVEKVLDGLTLVAIIVLSLTFMTPPTWVWRLTAISAALFSLGFVMLFMLRYHREWLLSRIEGFFVRLHLRHQAARAHATLTAFAEGLGSISSWTLVLRMMLLTGALWTEEGIMIWSLMKVFHLPLPPTAGIFFTAVVGLASVVPAAPANVGAYEFFGSAALRLAGLVRGGALALVLVLHAWTFLSTTILGFICFFSAGLHFREFRSELKVAPEAAVPAESVPAAMK